MEKFADAWEAQVLTHQKPSSVKSAKSHLKTYIRKHLGKVLLHELTPQIQQNFVTLLSESLTQNCPQRPRNSFLDDADSEIVGLLHTARHSRRARFAGRQDPPSTALFTGEQARKIITIAPDPWRTMFAIAAMTGFASEKSWACKSRIWTSTVA